MKILILCLLITTSVSLSAQSISTADLSWNVTKTFNASTGDVDPAPSVIVTHSNSSVTWKDIQGNIKYDFHVTETDGQWTSTTSDGEIVYEVTYDGGNGNIRFTRSGGEIKIRIVLIPTASPDSIFYELSVDNISTIQ